MVRSAAADSGISRITLQNRVKDGSIRPHYSAVKNVLTNESQKEILKCRKFHVNIPPHV